MSNQKVSTLLTTEALISEHLEAAGFVLNSHSDRYDRGEIGVYFDDNEMVVVSFAGKPGWGAIRWRSTLSLAMPVAVIVACLEAMK